MPRDFRKCLIPSIPCDIYIVTTSTQIFLHFKISSIERKSLESKFCQILLTFLYNFIVREQVEKMKTKRERNRIFWYFGIIFHTLTQVFTQKYKIFGWGNQKLFIFKGFSLLNYKEKPLNWPKGSFFKNDCKSRCKRSELLIPSNKYFDFLCGETLISMWKKIPKFQRMQFLVSLNFWSRRPWFWFGFGLLRERSWKKSNLCWCL